MATTPPNFDHKADDYKGPIIQWLRQWRWWWILAIAFAGFATIVNDVIVSYWQSYDTPILVILTGLLIIMWTAFALWAFLIAPLMSARDHNAQFTAPPRWHLNTLRLAVWVPAILLVSCWILMDCIPSILLYIERDVWYPKIEGAVFLGIIPILAACIMYARIMGRILERKLRTTTQKRAVCFECGYPLHSIQSPQCPECGTAIVELI